MVASCSFSWERNTLSPNARSPENWTAVTFWARFSCALATVAACFSFLAEGGSSTAVCATAAPALIDGEITVWDSTSEARYMVLPARPAGTGDLAADELASLVTRNGLIGTALV